MNADQELHAAIQERIVKENTFFNLLKEAIKNAVDKFDLCDTSTSPEVEESVHLSIYGLQKAIDKLKDEAAFNKEASDSIKKWFSDLSQKNNLVKDSKLATSSTPTRSFADRAKGWLGFSAPPLPAMPPDMPPPPYVQPPEDMPPPYVQPPPAMPPPYVQPPAATPSQSFLTPLQYLRNPLQSWQNPQTAPAWKNVIENHNNPKNFNERVIFPTGGKRKTRKYRRRV